ncbi:MAG: xanthine dehydrogenase family protein subunit M [Alphaproteobacteria bacterium]|jgi:carbon-monoxide dehydrogenase medium subunit|nr:xanthine dehydrogenase family protein subunit M [Alphaproteobacteria bacterium]MDP6816265.1 xanthine dehydrogenase family protein subunit M [Alphaproteobacteria bacterium]
MKAPDFEYQRPESLAEALDLLARHGGEAAIVAGGQSLMPILNFRLAAPALLIDIGGLAELRQVNDGGDHLVLGAGLRYCDLEASELVARHLPLLHSALGHVGHPAIRHRGTLGGSLAMADPAAELPACCLALDGEFTLTSQRGERRFAADGFFQGVYDTALADDEILTAVHLPKRPPDAIWAFDEVARRRGDFALAGLALVGRPANGALGAPRLVLLGVADRPLLAGRTMALLEGVPLDEDLIDAAVETVAAEVDPPDDPAYPPEYRRHLAGVLLRRVLRRVAAELSS